MDTETRTNTDLLNGWEAKWTWLIFSIVWNLLHKCVLSLKESQVIRSTSRLWTLGEAWAQRLQVWFWVLCMSVPGFLAVHSELQEGTQTVLCAWSLLVDPSRQLCQSSWWIWAGECSGALRRGVDILAPKAFAVRVQVFTWWCPCRICGNTVTRWGKHPQTLCS